MNSSRSVFIFGLVLTALLSAPLYGMEVARQAPSTEEEQSLIAQLSKAVIERDFNHYFAVLAQAPLDKQRELCNMPVYKNGSTALHFAAEQGNAAALTKLLEYGAAVDQINQGGDTPLFFAAKSGNRECVSLLIDRGGQVQVHTVNFDGNTALHYAAWKNRADVITSLIKAHGCNPNSTNKKGERPISFAIAYSSFEAIIALINNGADLTEPQKARILYLAASAGCVPLITLLIKDKGCDPNVEKEGETALHRAAANGHYDALYQLLVLGADKNASDESGYTALHHAALHDRSAIVVALIKYFGFDPNSTTSRNVTPLSIAAGRGNVAAIHALLQSGATINRGHPTLHMAARTGMTPAVISLIKDYGCDPNAKIGLSDTPFATTHSCLTKFALLSAGAVVYDEEKASCCLAALTSGSDRNTLLEALTRESLAPWNVNAVSGNNQETALIKAVKRCHLPCIKLLLKDPRTNPNIKNAEGKTALHCAMDMYLNNSFYDLCALLLRYQRTAVSITDDTGRTATGILNNRLQNLRDATPLFFHNSVINNSIEKIEAVLQLFRLRNKKAQLYWSLNKARCSDHCPDEVCQHMPKLPDDIRLKIARLLKNDSFPQTAEKKK